MWRNHVHNGQAYRITVKANNVAHYAWRHMQRGNREMASALARTFAKEIGCAPSHGWGIVRSLGMNNKITDLDFHSRQYPNGGPAWIAFLRGIGFVDER